MKTQFQPNIFELSGKITGGFKNEMMMTIGIEAMASAQTLVDQQGQVVIQCDAGSRLQRRVFLRPECMVSPVKYELTRRV
jgi:chemotaxis receptor (MCP) glutamine deamidase CheD